MKKIYPLLIGVMMAMGWQLIAVSEYPITSCRSDVEKDRDIYFLLTKRESSITGKAQQKVKNYLQNYYTECSTGFEQNSRGNLSIAVGCSPSNEMLCAQYPGINRTLNKTSQWIRNLPSVEKPWVPESSGIEEDHPQSEDEGWITRNLPPEDDATPEWMGGWEYPQPEGDSMNIDQEKER